MTKLLNLDKIATSEPEQEVVLFGETHKVIPMSVENFIVTTNQAEKLARASIQDQISGTVEMVSRSIPTVDQAKLRKMSLKQLQIIAAFIRGEDLDEVEEKKADDETKEIVAGN